MEKVATLKEEMEYFRSHIKAFSQDLLEVKNNLPEHSPEADIGEIMANLTLSYRHLEDAIMRLGKVLQANDGGISVYDNPGEEK